MDKPVTIDELDQYWAGNVRRLLDAIAFTKTCSCGRAIWMVRHKSNALTPYTDEGVNHFIDCPDREKFRAKATR